MKKTRLLVLLRNIRATKVSFFSIVLFVALGIAIFLGIKWNSPALKSTVDKYYDEYQFHDFVVSFPFGITNDDLEDIKALDIVTNAEGGYTATGTSRVGTKSYTLAVQSLTNTLNITTANEGVLPCAENEVGIEQKFAEAAGLNVGDKIAIQSTIGEKDSFNEKEFTITAIVENPAYISASSSFDRGYTGKADGSVNYYVIMHDSAFNKDAYMNCFSNVYIRCDSLRGMSSFGDDYNSAAEKLSETLEALGKEKGYERYDAVITEYRAEIKNAEQQIADGEKKIEDGKKEIADGEKEIASFEEKISEGEKKISDGEKELEEGKKKFEEAEKEIAEKEAQLKDAERE
ncbi:MAG: hypothetical protein ACI4QR_02690, partial [Eubacteriales bacterium]